MVPPASNMLESIWFFLIIIILQYRDVGRYMRFRQCGGSPRGTSAGLLPWPGIPVQAWMERRLTVGVARQVLQPVVNWGYLKCFVGWVAFFAAGLMNGVHFWNWTSLSAYFLLKLSFYQTFVDCRNVIFSSWLMIFINKLLVTRVKLVLIFS